MTHRFPLDEGEADYALVRGKKDDVMKAILVPDE